MNPKLLMWVFLVWFVGVMVDSFVGNVSHDHEAQINQLVSAGTLHTPGILDKLGIPLPLPTGDFFGVLISMVTWNFTFFADWPYSLIRVIFLVISLGIVVGLLVTFLPSIIGAAASVFGGIFRFLPFFLIR